MIVFVLFNIVTVWFISFFLVLWYHTEHTIYIYMYCSLSIPLSSFLFVIFYICVKNKSNHACCLLLLKIKTTKIMFINMKWSSSSNMNIYNDRPFIHWRHLMKHFQQTRNRSCMLYLNNGNSFSPFVSRVSIKLNLAVYLICDIWTKYHCLEYSSSEMYAS